jgi:hypothetical protein
MIALIKELRQRWWMSHDMQGKGSSGVGIGRGRSVAMQAKARAAARGTVPGGPAPGGGRGGVPVRR